jgi:hypothetical protein
MNTRQLIETYHNAWTTGDFAAARRCLADDLDFQGSMDRFNKADDFIAALTQFQRIVRSATVVRSFFDADGAVLLYDCETASPAGVIRTAEFFSTRDEKIVEIRLVFDPTALRAMMQR